nr:replication-associated protein [Cressdnaviricota sp.]
MASDKMASLKTGNTKTVLSLKRRDWFLTVNESSIDYYEEIENYFLNLKSLTYYICVEHIGSENKHYHIFAQFNNSIKLSLKKLHGCHVEALRGTPQEALTYIKCEDDKHIKNGITYKLIYEYGELRKHGKSMTAKEVMKANDEELKDLDFRFYNSAMKIKETENEKNTFNEMLTEIENENLKAPEIIYIYGEPGNGKTYGGYKLAMSKYEKPDIGRIYINNKYFKIINENAKCFVIEEFRDSQLPISEFLQFTDKYGYTAATKGGFKTIRPECIIICCYKCPNLIYNNVNENHKQFLRRLTTIYRCEKFVFYPEDVKIYLMLSDI